MSNGRLPVHVIFTAIYFLGALVTLLPWMAANKTCILGYKALCSFSPISTLLFLALGGLHIYLHSRSEAQRSA